MSRLHSAGPKCQGPRQRPEEGQRERREGRRDARRGARAVQRPANLVGWMTAAVLIAVAATWALLVPIRSSCDVPFPQPNATLTWRRSGAHRVGNFWKEQPVSAPPRTFQSGAGEPGGGAWSMIVPPSLPWIRSSRAREKGTTAQPLPALRGLTETSLRVGPPTPLHAEAPTDGGGWRQPRAARHRGIVRPVVRGSAPSRLIGQERTRYYVERRTKEGLSKKEIMRCLKRYVARDVYRCLVGVDGL